MLAHVNFGAPLPAYTFHSCRAVLNQGDLGACTGTSARAWLEARPVMTKIGDGPTWRAIYDRAQALDPFPGAEPQMSGSTVRAAFKALQEWGYIESYVWAESMETANTFLRQQGPLVFGTMWTQGMMSPDANNYIHATGNSVGGHAYLVYGFSSRRNAYRIRNSWGNWGVNGSCWISAADLGMLFAKGGECAAAIQRAA
jgi:hypothetical protein